MQQDKTSKFTFFQWNEFGPSAGLKAVLGSVRVIVVLTGLVLLKDQMVPWSSTNSSSRYQRETFIHDDAIKWKHFPRYWTFVQGILQSPVKYPHKGQWRRALIFYLICAWTNGWLNNRDADDSRRHRADYDITVMTVALVTHPRLSRNHKRLMWSDYFKTIFFVVSSCFARI